MRLAVQDRLISYFLIFQAIGGGATLAWLATRTQIPVGAWMIFGSLIIAALVAGVWSLRRRRWAALLGLIVFAVQIPIVITKTVTFYAWLAVHIDIAMTWQQQAKFGINLVALVMLIWACIRYVAPNNSFKPNLLRSTNNMAD